MVPGYGWELVRLFVCYLTYYILVKAEIPFYEVLKID